MAIFAPAESLPSPATLDYYHPDKVDTSIHGETHKVLCEEIAKRVSARYAQLKGED